MAEEYPPILGLREGDTPDKAIGLDIPRVWANGVQITNAGDNEVFVVFREQISLTATEGGESRLVHRNVASLAMPLPSVIALRDLLNRLYPQETGGDEPAE